MGSRNLQDAEDAASEEPLLKGSHRLTQDECEHLDADGRARRSAAAEFRSALIEFREDKRRQPPSEDPLDLLEWKHSNKGERLLAQSSARAVLGIRKRRRCIEVSSEGVAHSEVKPTAAPEVSRTDPVSQHAVASDALQPLVGYE